MNITEKQIAEWTYHSLALEGNPLTLAETEAVLAGETLPNRSVKEQDAVRNHKQAILHLLGQVEQAVPLSEEMIKEWHRLLRTGIDSQFVGEYRSEQVVSCGIFPGNADPDAGCVEGQIQAMLAWYLGSEAAALSPVERAVMLHSKFDQANPFIIGNGAIARLLLNYELLKSGCDPVIIRKEQRGEYYRALDKAVLGGEYGDLMAVVEKSHT